MTYVGCFNSYSGFDCFIETLSSTQCNSVSVGVCYSGNCNKGSMCTSNQCPPPFGTCSSSCYQCSTLYNSISISSLTNELCLAICVNNSFIYAGSNYG